MTRKKCDLSDFERDMIVGGRRAGLIISAAMLGFFTHIHFKGLLRMV